MNNSQINHFSKIPVDLGINRSLFERPKRRLDTFNAGQLIPLYCEEVLPGDTVSMDLSLLVRMATPIHPVMDNAFLDVHFYFVPLRILWTHAKQFFGENTQSAWIPSTTYTIPQIKAPVSGGDGVTSSSVKGWAKGSIAEHLRVPQRTDCTISHLPFRAYCHIWNNYYRDQNVFSPAYVFDGDTQQTGSNAGVQKTSGQTYNGVYSAYISGGSYITDASLGGACLPVCRLHDVFSSCLPGPQKGPAVTVSLGQYAPVVNSNVSTWRFQPNITQSDGTFAAGLLYTTSGGKLQITSGSPGSPTYNGYMNLAADLRNASAITVNQLRNSFMVQRYYERLARSGSRYFEWIKAFFDVTVPDATVQIPEFLGGRRVSINITQVAQTSATDNSIQNYTPLGNLSAYSLTTDKSELFSKSFTEHGYLMAVGCVRTEHTYSQGIPKHFSKMDVTEFYVPTFAFAPEQPVYTREIYADGSSTDSTVFGYQEAWYEYRYSPSECCGEFSVNYAQSLDVWHYGDDYASAPSLSPSWLREPQENVARTLAVTDHDQFIGDFLFNAKWVRAMPIYSIPGLLDHH